MIPRNSTPRKIRDFLLSVGDSPTFDSRKPRCEISLTAGLSGLRTELLTPRADFKIEPWWRPKLNNQLVPLRPQFVNQSEGKSLLAKHYRPDSYSGRLSGQPPSLSAEPSGLELAVSLQSLWSHHCESDTQSRLDLSRQFRAANQRADRPLSELRNPRPATAARHARKGGSRGLPAGTALQLGAAADPPTPASRCAPHVRRSSEPWTSDEPRALSPRVKDSSTAEVLS